MSSVIVVYGNDYGYWGTDGALTLTMGDGSRYRQADDINKITIIDANTVLGITGISDLCNSIVDEFVSSAEKTPEVLQAIARRLAIQYPDCGTDLNGAELNKVTALLGKMEQGQFVLYELPSYDDFQITRRADPRGGCQCTITGYRTPQVTKEIEARFYGQKFTHERAVRYIKETFDQVSCQEIGGLCRIYFLERGISPQLVYQGMIKESPQEIHYISELDNNASPVNAGKNDTEQLTADRINTTDLYSERIYEPGNANNYLAIRNATWGPSLGLLKNGSTELFDISDQGNGEVTLSLGGAYLLRSPIGGGDSTEIHGAWDVRGSMSAGSGGSIQATDISSDLWDDVDSHCDNRYVRIGDNGHKLSMEIESDGTLKIYDWTTGETNYYNPR